jgi:hypothetical protein
MGDVRELSQVMIRKEGGDMDECVKEKRRYYE